MPRVKNRDVDVDELLEKQEPQIKVLAEAVRKVLITAEPDVEEHVK